MRGADHRERRTRLQGNTEGERERFGGRFQWGWRHGAGQSGHFGIASDGLHTGAGLFRHGRSGGPEPVLLHGHGGARSLDADERQRGERKDKRGGGATAMTAGPGAPSGNCNPPVLYIDTTNQDLWFCSATNSWKKPTADTSGLPTLAGSNTWTGYSNLSSGQWRPPESTVSNLPSATGNVGKVFMVTDAVSAGSCSTGGGSLRELCRANGSTYECVGGCGSAGGGSGTAAYISALLSG